MIDRLEQVRRRIISAGGDLERITIVAVTKGFGVDVVREALSSGLHDLGENYAQELVAKADAVAGEQPRWHFLGHVQSNKLGTLASRVSLWHGIDRPSIAEALAQRSPGAAVLVQVNVTDDGRRNGCRRDEVNAVVSSLRRLDLDVRGLMAVAPQGSPEDARPHFRWLARTAADLELGELSMGMSSDLEVAVEEGSTIVRIGRALFGARSERAEVRR